MLHQSRLKHSCWLYSSICPTVSHRSWRLSSVLTTHHTGVTLPPQDTQILIRVFFTNTARVKTNKAADQKQAEEQINFICLLAVPLLLYNPDTLYLSLQQRGASVWKQIHLFSWSPMQQLFFFFLNQIAFNMSYKPIKWTMSYHI